MAAAIIWAIAKVIEPTTIATGKFFSKKISFHKSPGVNLSKTTKAMPKTINPRPEKAKAPIRFSFTIYFNIVGY